MAHCMASSAACICSGVSSIPNDRCLFAMEDRSPLSAPPTRQIEAAVSRIRGSSIVSSAFHMRAYRSPRTMPLAVDSTLSGLYPLASAARRNSGTRLSKAARARGT